MPPRTSVLKGRPGSACIVVAALAVLAPATARADHLPAVLPLEPLGDHTHQILDGYANRFVNLFGITLESATMTGADLRGADLRYANLSGVDFTGADLSGADLRNTMCVGTVFAGATLDGTLFTSADMRGACLVGACMAGANLSNADLTDADLTSAEMRDTTIVNGTMVNATLVDASLLFTNLSYADLRGANLRHANGAVATLDRADFTGADLTDAAFFASSFILTRMVDIVATNCDFRLARMREAELDDAVLEYAQFDGANLFETRLLGADLGGAILVNVELLELAVADATTLYRCDTVFDASFDPAAEGWSLADPPTPPVLYVRADGPDGCGSSWAQAFSDLGKALNRAAGSGGAVQEVWVSAGVYRPTIGSGDPRSVSFVVPDGVAVYGGFLGNEIFRDDREPEVNLTVLSGDLNGDDAMGAYDDNAYQVVTIVDGGPATRLEGFFVEGGRANGAAPAERGGGILIDGGEPRVERCVVRDNEALLGGGMAVMDGAPLVVACRITDNRSLAGGVGGGIALVNSDARLVSVTIARNDSAADPVSFGSGVFAFGLSDPVLVNCTITDNVAANPESAAVDARLEATVHLTNAIVWGNDPGPLVAVDGAALDVTYSIIAGGWPGTANVDADPRFLTDDPDYRLAILSPAIDSGDTPALGAEDILDALWRERRLDDFNVPDSGVAGLDGVTVDRGSVEFTGLSPDTCAPDVNGDGSVNLQDLLFVLASWGECAGGCEADINQDGIVSIADIVLVLSSWGLCEDG